MNVKEVVRHVISLAKSRNPGVNLIMEAIARAVDHPVVLEILVNCLHEMEAAPADDDLTVMEEAELRATFKKLREDILEEAAGILQGDPELYEGTFMNGKLQLRLSSEGAQVQADSESEEVFTLEDGKYTFIRQDGLLKSALRYGEEWKAGLDHFAHSKAFHALLNEIARLRQVPKPPNPQTKEYIRIGRMTHESISTLTGSGVRQTVWPVNDSPSGAEVDVFVAKTTNSPSDKPKHGPVIVNGMYMCCEQMDRELRPHDPARRCLTCPGGSTNLNAA